MWKCLKCKTTVISIEKPHEKAQKDCNCLYCHASRCNGTLKGDLPKPIKIL